MTKNTASDVTLNCGKYCQQRVFGPLHIFSENLMMSPPVWGAGGTFKMSIDPTFRPGGEDVAEVDGSEGRVVLANVR